MVRESNVEESSSSKSNSVLGRREDGFGSVSFTRVSNYEEGSSSSHSHVNNLQEQQRLMMLRSQGLPRAHAFSRHVNHMNNLEEEEQRLVRFPYHRRIQAMPRPQHTEPISSSNTRVYPPGSRFLPTEIGCLRVHLRSKVEKNKSGFIKTLDLYKDDPWLLDHVQNDLFPRGEWYYFSPRNKRGASSLKRSVSGSGGGGTWKTITKKKPMMDKDNKVQGYIQKLVYNKTSVNGETMPTGWSMMEYCLYEGNQDDLVLCHLKGNLNKKGFADEEVMKKNISSNQLVQHHQEEEEAGANGDHCDATPQQQQEEDAPVLGHEGQGLGVETMMMTKMLPQEDHDDATPQQQHEQDEMAHVLPPHEGQDLGFETTTQNNNDNNFMPILQEDHGDQRTPQQQQQEQDAPVLPLTSHDPWFDTVMETEEEDIKHHWDDPALCFSVDELLDDVKHLQQRDSQARDALGVSAD